ncbi:nucleoside hydrolase [Bacteroidota bacterium]
MKKYTLYAAIISITWLTSCTNSKKTEDTGRDRIPVILDTDANNELDDQHAIAYLLKSQETFDIKGITVNATRGGGLVEEQFAEAMRIVTLFEEQDRIPLKKGANASFDVIMKDIERPDFDGAEAVNFIIAEARKYKDNGLVLIPIGKLTNIALALEKAPDISANIRIVWLGSNYPDPGEYNLDNDTAALNYILDQDVVFEMVTVRYGNPTGTWAILVSLPDIEANMPGKGPTINNPITGRHGGSFTNFGDYSLDLFTHIELYGDPPSRSLFDVGAVAVVKNSHWAESNRIAAPKYTQEGWEERPGNQRNILLWETFQRDSIVADFFAALDK